MNTNKLKQLKNAMRAKTLVRFKEKYGKFYTYGYVLGVSSKYCLFVFVEDGCLFDGFLCLPITEISKIEPAPYRKFHYAVLKKHRIRVPENPNIKLDTMEDIILSAAHKFPLVVIFREKIKPGVCEIGKVRSIENGILSLQEINPDASWDKGVFLWKLKEITQVQFGGKYEAALYLIGGNPPKY